MAGSFNRQEQITLYDKPLVTNMEAGSPAETVTEEPPVLDQVVENSVVNLDTLKFRLDGLLSKQAKIFGLTKKAKARLVELMRKQAEEERNPRISPETARHRTGNDMIQVSSTGNTAADRLGMNDSRIATDAPYRLPNQYTSQVTKKRQGIWELQAQAEANAKEIFEAVLAYSMWKAMEDFSEIEASVTDKSPANLGLAVASQIKNTIIETIPETIGMIHPDFENDDLAYATQQINLAYLKGGVPWKTEDPIKTSLVILLKQFEKYPYLPEALKVKLFPESEG